MTGQGGGERICIGALLLLFAVSACQYQQGDRYRTWGVYRGDAKSTSYSALDQINRENVDRLEVAWIYHSGDERDAGSQANPIIIDGAMYLTTLGIKVAALDAATGEQKWIFDPFEGEEPQFVNRGVMYWEEGEDPRIFITAGNFLYALDAETGSLISEFGDDGVVDLREELDRDPNLLNVRATSPGIVHGSLLIMGSGTGEREIGSGAHPGLQHQEWRNRVGVSHHPFPGGIRT